MSVEVLRGMRSIPDVLGSALLAEQGVLLRDAADLLPDEKFVLLGRLFNTTRIAGSRAGLDVEVVDYEMDGARAFSYRVAGDRQLVVLSLPEANFGFLDLSARMALDQLAAFKGNAESQNDAIAAEVLEEITAELAPFIGPAAKTIVRKVHKKWQADGAPDRARLVQALGAEVDAPEDRAAFRLRLSRLI